MLTGAGRNRLLVENQSAYWSGATWTVSVEPVFFGAGRTEYLCVSHVLKTWNALVLWVFTEIISGKPLYHHHHFLLLFFFFSSSSSSSSSSSASSSPPRSTTQVRTCVYCTTSTTVSEVYILVSLSSIHNPLCIPDKEQDAGIKTNPCNCQRGFSSAVKITVLTKSGHKHYKGLDSKTDRLTVSCEMRSKLFGELCDWWHIWVPVILNRILEDFLISS